jgi:hypothetical protein
MRRALGLDLLPMFSSPDIATTCRSTARKRSMPEAGCGSRFKHAADMSTPPRTF